MSSGRAAPGVMGIKVVVVTVGYRRVGCTGGAMEEMAEGTEKKEAGEGWGEENKDD